MDSQIPSVPKMIGAMKMGKIIEFMGFIWVGWMKLFIVTGNDKGKLHVGRNLVTRRK